MTALHRSLAWVIVLVAHGAVLSSASAHLFVHPAAPVIPRDEMIATAQLLIGCPRGTKLNLAWTTDVAGNLSSYSATTTGGICD